MDGEFIAEEQVGVAKGVAGGNIIIQGETQAVTLAAARRAVEAIADMPGVVTPFPGGVVRSGSKVGSKYKALARLDATTPSAPRSAVACRRNSSTAPSAPTKS